MEQESNNAAAMDAQIKPDVEKCACIRHMGQRSNDAAMKDA